MLTATRAQCQALQARMYAAIPLARAMAVEVAGADDAGLVLRAPLAANANDHDTAFGGSVSALATLAGWGLLYLLLDGPARQPLIVIQRGAVDYRRPITEDLVARAVLPDASAWRRFSETLRRKGRGRIVVHVDVSAAAAFAGHYVVDERGRSR